MNQESKDKLKELGASLKEKLKTGFSVSKKALKEAGVAVQDLSDKSVIALEIKQFESKRKKAIAALGTLAADQFISKKAASVSAKDEEVDILVKEITKCNKEIAKREKLLKSENTEEKKPAVKKTPAKKTAEKKTADKAPVKKSSSKKAKTE